MINFVWQWTEVEIPAEACTFPFQRRMLGKSVGEDLTAKALICIAILYIQYVVWFASIVNPPITTLQSKQTGSNVSVGGIGE